MSNKTAVNPVDQMIEDYVQDSSIKKIIYNNISKTWTVIYDYNIADDMFKTFDELITFLQADSNEQ